MSATSEQEKILAAAVYEIRLLLSGYLGSTNEGDLAVRQAAHIAYALHNQALQSLDGSTFNVAGAKSSVSAVDGIVGGDFIPRFERLGVSWKA